MSPINSLLTQFSSKRIMIQLVVLILFPIKCRFIEDCHSLMLYHVPSHDNSLYLTWWIIKSLLLFLQEPVREEEGWLSWHWSIRLDQQIDRVKLNSLISTILEISSSYIFKDMIPSTIPRRVPTGDKKCNSLIILFFVLSLSAQFNLPASNSTLQ